MVSDTKTEFQGDRQPHDGSDSSDYNQSQQAKINYKVARRNHCLIEDKPGIEADRIKVLRTHLLNHTRAKNWRTIMITSVQPGEGKTVTAINLAFAMAQDYQQSAVLVDCDLRRPSIARYLGINGVYGIEDYFIHDTPLDKIKIWPGIEKLMLIAGNTPVIGSTEIMGSQKMGTLVNELKSQDTDRYIFFDTPPLLSNADPIAFLPHVDCVLLIVEAGRTTSREIRKAQNMIPLEKLLGLVLNKDTTPYSKYYY